jgi:hypothetical protein
MVGMVLAIGRAAPRLFDIGDITMAREKRSKRLAFDAAGKDTNDLTEAVSATYQYLEPDAADPEKSTVVAEIEFDPATAPAELVKAYAIFGFHTHAGNWINRLVNTQGKVGTEVVEGIDEYRQMMAEAGWTNRKGEATAGAGIFIEALARLRHAEDGGDLDNLKDRVTAAWGRWSDDVKDGIRKDDKVKAEVAKIRAERATAKAEKGETTSVVSSLEI